jgi:hypothetical protein
MAAAPRLPLLREAGAQSCKFGVADRTRLFQPIQFFDFIRDAETNHAPEFITGRLSLLDIAFRHASSLKDQICKHSDVWKYYKAYYPDCFDPTRNVVTPEQIGRDSNEQPQPHDEEEYREGVQQEISKSEAFPKEEHRDPPFVALRRKSFTLIFPRPRFGI